MNEETNTQNDQAAELRKLFNDVQQEEIKQTEHMEEIPEENDSLQKVDILNLPPRNEVHGKSKKRVKIKLSRPYVRLITVTIFIMLIFTGAYYLWGNELLSIIKSI